MNSYLREEIRHSYSNGVECGNVKMLNLLTGSFEFASTLSSLLSSLLILRHQDDTAEQKASTQISTKTGFISCENAKVLTQG